MLESRNNIPTRDVMDIKFRLQIGYGYMNDYHTRYGYGYGYDIHIQAF